MIMDTVFTIPEAEVSDTAQLHKRKQGKRQEIYDKLKEAAYAKICVMENDVWGKLEACYEAHRTRGAALGIDHRLRQGTASASATAISAPTAPRISAFKPNEAFH